MRGLITIAAQLADRINQKHVVLHYLRMVFFRGLEIGRTERNNWREIEREDGGFAKEECLDKMCECIPFIVYDKRYNDHEVVTYDNVADMLGEIDRKPQYSHWRPIWNPIPKGVTFKKQ